MKKSCKSCYFWIAFVSVKGCEHYRRCRFRPPQVIGEGSTVWPETHKDNDWCGEYIRNDNLDESHE